MKHHRQFPVPAPTEVHEPRPLTPALSPDGGEGALRSRRQFPPESFMLIGTEGSLLLQIGHAPLLFPDEKFKNYQRPQVPRRNHYHHFVDACLGGEKTESHFAQTGPMTEAILLGTVAIRVPNTKLAWDSKNLRITNHDAANQFLRRKYRAGWGV